MDHDAEPNPDEADRAPDRWIGRTIAGTFHIDALIGEGAMGRVYAGAHVERGERVALKLLHPHLGGDPRIAKRFHREAKAASRLSHPSSLHIIDFGADADGTLFIAMELLEGEDLQTIIDHDAPLSPARIAELMKQTLSALEEAHRVGIIHRDLKPENVVVIREGDVERVKVCDFGIAKIVESEGRSTAITKDGYVCGTPEYMAPEQARGDEIDARADVYSAGVVLYQLLCGRVPFKAENALGTITKHIMETPVPPRRVRPAWGIPRSLERIALTALAKRPNERFASARAMSQAIDEAMMALGDAAEHRLGEGPFSAPADLHDEPEDDAPAEAASTHDVIAKVVAPDDRRWMYAAALGLVALAGALVYSATMRAPAPAIAAPAAPAPPAPLPAPEPPPRVEPPPPEPPPEPPEARIVDEPAAPPESPRRRARRPEPPVAAPTATDLDRGREAMIAGDLRGAIDHLERYARANPSHAVVQQQLGRAYMRAGDVERGVAAYRRYLRLAPNAPDRAIVERILAPHGG